MRLSTWIFHASNIASAIKTLDTSTDILVVTQILLRSKASDVNRQLKRRKKSRQLEAMSTQYTIQVLDDIGDDNTLLGKELVFHSPQESIVTRLNPTELHTHPSIGSGMYGSQILGKKSFF